MNDFKEFISLIDPNTYVSIRLNVDQFMKDAQRLDDFDLGFYTALALLEKYHNWNIKDQ